MAYSSPAAPTDQGDLMAKVSTFAVSTMGWTEDYYENSTYKMMSLHKGNCYVHFSWNDNSSASYPSSIAMYQGLAYLGDPPTYYPWEHTNDSGYGHDDKTSPDLSNERSVSFIGDGAYTALHMFGSTSPDPDVIYCVLEYSPGLYRHFAFGNTEKYGTWTGGEFVAGHYWSRYTQPDYLDDPDYSHHSILLDGLTRENGGAAARGSRIGATVHCEGFPNQGSTKWGQCGDARLNAGDATTYRLDRDGYEMLPLWGGCRNGPALLQYGWQEPDITKGYIPVIPIELYYVDISAAPDNYYLIGRLANMGHIQMKGLDPNTTITIGGDTWRVFPAVRKSKVGGNIEESWWMGLIYKQ